MQFQQNEVDLLKIFCQLKYFLKTIFLDQRFWTSIFIGLKIFWTQYFFEQKFSDQQVFYLKLIKAQNLVLTKYLIYWPDIMLLKSNINVTTK